MTIPPIPDTKISFGDEGWIACRIAHGYLKEVMALGWQSRKRFSEYSNGKPTAPAKCEICDELVETGKHMTRGYLKWIHEKCCVEAREFVRIVDERCPATASENDEPSYAFE